MSSNGVTVSVDSKQFFHSTFDKLIEAESWGKLKPARSSEANRNEIRKLAGILLKPKDAEAIHSLNDMKGVVKRWLVVNGPELDQSDRARVNSLRQSFMKAGIKLNLEGVNRLIDDGEDGLKACITRGLNPEWPIEMNYEALKNYCLEIPLKIEVVNRFFIRKMFDLCFDQEWKEALAMDCIQAAGFDAPFLQDLLCEQFRHLKIEDEAARCRIAEALLMIRPDLFLKYFAHFHIHQESNRVQLAIFAMQNHIALFLCDYARFNITSDTGKMQVALELALLDPQLAEANRKLLHLTNFEHRDLFNTFLFCQASCGIVFNPHADPALRNYENKLLEWIHMEFPAEWTFPDLLVEKWRLGLFYLLEKPLDVHEAQKIVQWAVERNILSTEHFAQFEKIHSSNRVHLAIALYQKDPAWAAENLFVIARSKE